MDEKTIIFIFVTNICNLKCLGCMQSCDRENKNPYFVDIEELKKQLLYLRDKTLTINGKRPHAFNLTGGEPLLHPQFMEICELIIQLFPNFSLSICSNGVLLNKLSDNDLIKLNNMGVRLQISLYPDMELFNFYDALETRIKKLNLDIMTGSTGGSHFYFNKQDTAFGKEQKFRNYGISCETELKNQDFVVLLNGRIYSCQKDINYLQRETEFIDESINIFEIEDKQELMQNKKHDFCKFCESNNCSGGQDYILWTHHNKNANLVFNHNLKDLYLNYYDIYYSLQHNYQNYKEILQNEIFQKYLPDDQKRFANTRYLKGKGDILIPIDNNSSLELLKNYLQQQQDIIEYNLYFISLSTDKSIEEELYNTFIPFNIAENLNTYLLKASNLVDMYKTFYKNSYLKNKFILNNNHTYLSIEAL